jgi:hypothetical protein
VLGVEDTVVESVGLEPDGRGGEVLVAAVLPKAGVTRRCSRCRRRCAGYDTSPTARRWRGLDLGSTRVFLEARTRRVRVQNTEWWSLRCPSARPGSRFTTAFEDTCAWLVCHAALSVIVILLRWRGGQCPISSPCGVPEVGLSV